MDNKRHNERSRKTKEGKRSDQSGRPVTAPNEIKNADSSCQGDESFELSLIDL
jgi:hypothetical protein